MVQMQGKKFFIKGFYQKFEVVTHFNIFVKYFLVHWIQQLIPKLRIKMVPGLSSFYLYLPTFTYFYLLFTYLYLLFTYTELALLFDNLLYSVQHWKTCMPDIY